MFIFCFPFAKSINDLEKETKPQSYLRAPTNLRAEFEIAVIDDQPFSPEQNLKNNSFQIRSFRDISSVKEIEKFPIILCDLQGVGINLASELQGSYLIEEIKSNYPEKVVIAFTGGSTNSSIFKRAIKFADNYIKKDATIDEWRDVLDKHIQHLSDPVHVWKQVRIRLVKAGITPIELIRVEHEFVKCYKSGAELTRQSIATLLNKNIFESPVRKEILSFTASKVFDLIFAGLVTQ
jgi:hypothetical protein